MSINIILVRFLNQALRYGSVKFQYFSLENSIPKKKKKKKSSEEENCYYATWVEIETYWSYDR